MKHIFRYGLLLLCGILQGAPLDEPLPDIIALHRAYQADPEKNEAAWDRAMQSLNDRIERQIFQTDATYCELKARVDAAQQALKAAQKTAANNPAALDLLGKLQVAGAELKTLSPDDGRARELELKRRQCLSLTRQLRFKIAAEPGVKAAAKQLDEAQNTLGERSRLLIERSALPAAKVFRDAVALSESAEKQSNIRFAGCYQAVGNPFKDLYRDVPKEKSRELPAEGFDLFLRDTLKRENPDADPVKLENYVKLRSGQIPIMPDLGQAALEEGKTPLDEVVNALSALHAGTAKEGQVVQRMRMAALKMKSPSFSRMETMRLVADITTDKLARKNRRNTTKNEIVKLILAGKVDAASAPSIYNIYGHLASDEDWTKLDTESAGVELDPWLRQMITGRAAIVRAWDERGNGYAYTVKTEGWQGFGKQLDKARTAFYEALKLRPDLAQPHLRLISVEMGGGTVEKRIEAFKNLLKVDPTNDIGHENIAWGLLPRWGGSHELILQLGDAALEYPYYDTLIPAFGFDMMGRVVRDYPDFRWKNVYLREGIIDKGDRLYEERLKAAKYPESERYGLYHRALFEMATLRYDQAAATVARLGGEKAFSDAGQKCYWRGVGTTNWYPRIPSFDDHAPVLLRLFTGKHAAQLQSLEKRYLDGESDTVLDELAKLIAGGGFTPEEKNVLIDLFGRWSMDIGPDEYRECDGKVMNAFQAAGSEGYSDVLKAMLAMGYDFSKYELYPGETAILIAGKGTDPELLDILKKAGDPLNRPEPEHG
ncbi:MAG: tetratricopeptide repeat protein, partial [Victivallaceae bacterium]